MFVKFSVFDVFGKSLLTLYKVSLSNLNSLLQTIINKIDTDPAYIRVGLYRRRFVVWFFIVFYLKDKNFDLCCLPTLRSVSRTPRTDGVIRNVVNLPIYSS